MALPIPFRFALRELRGGLRGFYVFIACIALGVASIAAVGSVSRALIEGINERGQEILGGDAAFVLIHRTLGQEERGFLDDNGRVARTATLRAMARGDDTQTLTELKAVEPSYPLYGTVEVDGGDLQALLAPVDGVFGIVPEQALLDRLGLAIGDRLRVGDLDLEVRGVVESEPDKLAGGLGFGPRSFIAMEGLDATNLVQPGSLIRWRYGVALEDRSDAALAAFLEDAKTSFPDAGWEIRSRANAAPGLTAQINRFTQYLTLVGFTALIVGGVGVANAVRAHLDTRRPVIATLKSVGASGGQVFGTYFIEILLIAVLAIAIGLVLGALAPLLTGSLLANILPVGETSIGLYPRELAFAFAYGVLIAVIFALWPLGRARDTPVSTLFREHVTERRGRPRAVYLAGLVLALALLVGVSVGLAYDPLVAAIFLAGAVAVVFVLRLVAFLIIGVARALPRPRSVVPRLALGNIHRPGSLTPTVVLSLGLGLTLFVTIGLIDGNLTRELQRSLPDKAPSFFFLDIPRDRSEGFTDLVAETAPGGVVEVVPMMRGRIISLDGIRSEDFDAAPEAAWVLRGDRGITYEALPPEGSEIVDGEWWPEDYDGPPLVSFAKELADELGLELGDRIVVNVLGRTIEATLANTRTVIWESLSINFVMVFSPNTFAGAPHMMLATVTLPDATDEVESAVARAVAADFPEVATVRVKEALDAFNGVVEQLALAIRAASAVTLVAGILVLAGALAASHRHRIYDAVVLKTLGATRGRLLTAYVLEFAALGAATALFALIAGAIAGYLVTAEVFEIDFVLLPRIALMALVSALIVTVGLGLAGTWHVLGQQPARHLREL